MQSHSLDTSGTTTATANDRGGTVADSGTYEKWKYTTQSMHV